MGGSGLRGLSLGGSALNPKATWDFPIIQGGTYLTSGVLVRRILLLRVLFLGSPGFSETPIFRPKPRSREALCLLPSQLLVIYIQPLGAIAGAGFRV